MEYFVENENISFDYSEEREINGDMPYRITLYDKYGHFDNEFFMSTEQMDGLIEGVKKIIN